MLTSCLINLLILMTMSTFFYETRKCDIQLVCVCGQVIVWVSLVRRRDSIVHRVISVVGALQQVTDVKIAVACRKICVELRKRVDFSSCVKQTVFSFLRNVFQSFLKTNTSVTVHIVIIKCDDTLPVYNVAYNITIKSIYLQYSNINE